MMQILYNGERCEIMSTCFQLNHDTARVELVAYLCPNKRAERIRIVLERMSFPRLKSQIKQFEAEYEALEDKGCTCEQTSQAYNVCDWCKEAWKPKSRKGTCTVISKGIQDAEK